MFQFQETKTSIARAGEQTRLLAFRWRSKVVPSVLDGPKINCLFQGMFIFANFMDLIVKNGIKTSQAMFG